VPTTFRRSTTDHWPTRIVRIDGQDVPLGGDIILTVTVEILRAGRVLELTGRAP
jgi:hypothetical protein